MRTRKQPLHELRRQLVRDVRYHVVHPLHRFDAFHPFLFRHDRWAFASRNLRVRDDSNHEFARRRPGRRRRVLPVLLLTVLIKVVLKVVFRVDESVVVKVFFFADVTRLPQRVRVAEVREIEAAVHVDAHNVVLFFALPFSLFVLFLFSKHRRNIRRGNNARSSKGVVGRGILAIPDWINFKNILSVSFRVLYRDTFSLFTKDAQKRAKHAR